MAPNLELADATLILIAVMGATGSGKTTFINEVTGSDLRVGHDLRACTADVEFSKSVKLGGKDVILVDTPGFDDTVKSDAQILQQITDFLHDTYKDKIKLAGVLFLHRISDVRVTGVTQRNFTMFQKLCGDSSLKNVVIVTTRWDMVTSERGEIREKQLASDKLFFQPALKKKAQLSRHDGSSEIGRHIVEKMVNNEKLPLQIQIEVVDKRMNLVQTMAGGELAEDIKTLVEKHEKEKAQLLKDLESANSQMRKELLEEVRRVREALAKSEAEKRLLESDYQAHLKDGKRPRVGAYKKMRLRMKRAFGNLVGNNS